MPTVTGRASGDLVMMSGHRKLFQCELIEMSANAAIDDRVTGM